MAGVDKEIEGEAVPMPGIKIGYLMQEPLMNPDQTVREAVEAGLGGVLAAKKRLDEVYVAYAEEGADFDALAEEQAKLEAIIAAGDGDSSEAQMEIAADALRIPPWDAVVGKLSGGEKRRVALCQLLLSKPDMLLLDEPTNHLDAESVDWLEQFLARFPGTVVAVTHDRYFLDNAAEWILELDRGSGIPWKGNYSSWLDQKTDRLQKEESSESARQRNLKKELEWVRQNPKGRQAKSKARMTRFEELSSYEYQRRNETSEIFIPVAERLGNEVIEFTNVTKSFGDRVLIDNLSMKIPPGAIVGVIGPNGAGKSTLFKLIRGTEKPDSGEIKIGPTVNLAFVTNRAMRLTVIRTCGKRYLAARTSCKSANSKCSPVPTLGALTSRVATSRNWSANCPVVSVDGCIWPLRCSKGATYCCLTSLQTIWMLRPCAHWKMRSKNLPAQ
jgi:sulfate-transporting ATPase